MGEEAIGFGILRRRRPLLERVRPRNVGRQVADTARDERSKEKMYEPGMLLKSVTKPMKDATRRIRKGGSD